MACKFLIEGRHIQFANSGTGLGGFIVSLSLSDNVSS